MTGQRLALVENGQREAVLNGERHVVVDEAEVVAESREAGVDLIGAVLDKETVGAAVKNPGMEGLEEATHTCDVRVHALGDNDRVLLVL